jgi:hypothetical protein
MPFPTTPVLDTFASLAGWTFPAYPGVGSFTNPGGQASGAAGLPGYADGYWNAGTFVADQEAFATIPVRGSLTLDLYLRIASPNTAGMDTYDLNVNGSTWGWYRTVDAAATAVGASFTQTISDGDSIGARTLGSGATVTLEAWYKPAAGAWTLIGTRTDSDPARLVNVGYIGLALQSDVIRADNFGGGAYVAPADGQPPIPFPPMLRGRHG